MLLVGMVPPVIRHASWPVRILAVTLVGTVAVTVLAAAVGTIRDLTTDPAPPSGVMRTWHGADWAWTNTARTRVGVEDGEADGHGVYAEYLTTGGTVRTLEDANGNAPGHSAEDARGVVTKLRVCEHDEGCSDWVGAP